MTAPLPPGWRHGRLSDVVTDITTGVSVNSEDRPCRNGEIGVLKITSVLNGVFEPEHHKAVIVADWEKVAGPVTGGTVLVSRANGNAALVGMSAYVPAAIPTLFLPDKLWALTARTGTNSRWLGHLVSTPLFRSAVLGAATGTSTLKNISQELYLSLPIVIPPRSEQDAIVAVLRTCDDGIAAARQLQRRQATATTEIGRRGLMLAAETLPPEWTLGTVGDVVASISSGTSVNSEDRPLKPGEIGVLKTTSVLTGIFDPDQHKAVVAAERKRVSQPVEGDTVLISRMNTADLVGLSAYVPQSYPHLFLPDRLWQLRMRRGFSARWLASLLGSPAFRPRLAAITAGTSGSMKNISQSAFLALPIPLPPIRQQEAIASALGEAEAYGTKLVQLTYGLQSQKRILMSSLLSGSLRVPPSLLLSNATPEMADA